MSFLEEGSVLLSFDVDSLGDYFDVSNLRMFHYGVQNTWIAVATMSHVLVMEGVRRSDLKDKGRGAPVQNIQIANLLPEYGHPLCLEWIMVGIVAVGFDSGYVVCFDKYASVIFEHKFSDVGLVSVLAEEKPTRVVWLLFENSNLFSVCEF